MAMRQKILHTPEGVKDIYGKECRKKLLLQEELHEMLHLYGYEDIQTPAFEFLEVFGRDTGSYLPENSINFLTGRETHLHCDRILHHR